MLCSHLEIGGWKAKDNLEFLTQIGESSADVVVGITERFKGQNVERIEQRVRSPIADNPSAVSSPTSSLSSSQ